MVSNFGDGLWGEKNTCVFLSLHMLGRGLELISFGISSRILSSPTNNQITPTPGPRGKMYCHSLLFADTT